MSDSLDIPPERPAEPERPRLRLAAMPRRSAFLAGCAAIAIAVVVAGLLPVVSHLSTDWMIEPAAAASPPVQEAQVTDDAKDLLARQRAILAAERERLHRLADEAVSTATRIEFGAMRLRAPGYASWAYGWVQSYVTSYQIIGRGFAGAYRHLVSGGAGSTLDAMTAEATGVVREHFRDLVVQPDRTQKALDAEWSRVATLLDQEFAQIDRQQIAFLVGLKGPPLPVETLRPSRVPDIGGTLAADAPDIDTILMRSARPMAARAGILAIRLTEVGSVAALVGSLGISFGPLTGLAVGVVGLSLAWGIDYIINSVDAALHRDELESHAVAFVDALEAETRQRLVEAFRAEIDLHFSVIDASLSQRILDLRRGG